MSRSHTGQASAAAAWDFRVTVRNEGSRPVVHIEGELDHDCAPLVTAMVEHVETLHGRPVRVDLTGVPYADTHGLAPLLQEGVVISRTSPEVHRLLRLLGLADPDGRSRPAAAPSDRRKRGRSAYAHRRQPALLPQLRR